MKTVPLIMKRCQGFALVAGVPAKRIGWMSRFGEQLDLLVEGPGETKCPPTGDIYALKDGFLSLL